MWPGFDSRSRRHMWVEFVVVSRPCSEGFSPGTPVFLPPQKPTFQIPIRPGNSGEKSHSVDSTESPIYLFIYFIIQFQSFDWLSSNIISAIILHPLVGYGMPIANWVPSAQIATSFPGSLIFPPPGAREGREDERPWERGCTNC